MFLATELKVNPCYLRALLSEIQHSIADPEIEEKQGKLEQLKSVLEMYGHFSGINRKVQMKYQPRGRPRGSSSDDGNPFFFF
jgi:inositol-hexakisphosphate/diphosphoinositol-pentakisphosphate 1-kinase